MGQQDEEAMGRPLRYQSFGPRGLLRELPLGVDVLMVLRLHPPLVRLASSRLLLRDTAHDVIDTQEHARRLYRRLDRLLLHGVGLPDAELLHVRDEPSVTVDAEGVQILGVLRALRRCRTEAECRIDKFLSSARAAILPAPPEGQPFDSSPCVTN